MATFTPTFKYDNIRAPSMDVSGVGAFGNAVRDVMLQNAQEKARQEQAARQAVADERAATEFGWRQKEYEQGIANRDFMKNYDPRIGIGGRGVEETTQRTMAGEGGDVVQQILASRGIQATPDGKGMGLTEYLGSASAEDRASLESQLADVGSRGLSRLQSTATQEPVRNAVFQDVLRQTGDAAQARSMADQFAAGVPTTRESLLAQEKARVDAINAQRKAMLEREKFAMEFDQKAYDNAIKQAKAVDKDFGTRGTGAGTSGALDRYELAQQVDKLLPKGWFGNKVDNPSAFEAGSKVIGKVPDDGRAITSAEVIAAMKQSYDTGTFDTTVAKDPESITRIVMENRARGSAPASMEQMVQQAYANVNDPQAKARIMELTGDKSGKDLSTLLQERGTGAFQGLDTRAPRAVQAPAVVPRQAVVGQVPTQEVRAAVPQEVVRVENAPLAQATPQEVAMQRAAVQQQIEDLLVARDSASTTAEGRRNIDMAIQSLQDGMTRIEASSGVPMPRTRAIGVEPAYFSPAGFAAYGRGRAEDLRRLRDFQVRN